MWSTNVQLGCLFMWVLWGAAVVAIGAGWWRDTPYLGHVGIVAAAGAGTLTIIKDNQRTRRMIRRQLDAGQQRGDGGRRHLVRIEDYV